MTDFAVQARLANDGDLLARISACVAGLGEADPIGWVARYAWQLAVRPGWCCSATTEQAYDQVGITDAMILAAVTEIRAAETPPE